MRACVEMAKAWRMDRYLRRLEAVMIVCDASVSLTLTGNGDVIEPEDGIIGARCPTELFSAAYADRAFAVGGACCDMASHAICTRSLSRAGIGSGGMFATAAARALIDVPDMDAEEIGRKSMGIAADMCGDAELHPPAGANRLVAEPLPSIWAA